MVIGVLGSGGCLLQHFYAIVIPLHNDLAEYHNVGERASIPHQCDESNISLTGDTAILLPADQIVVSVFSRKDRRQWRGARIECRPRKYIRTVALQ